MLSFVRRAECVNVSTTEMLLSRTAAVTGVWCYEIRRIRPDVSTGTLGRTYDEVFYVAEVDQVRSEAATVVQLVPVSLTGDRGPAAAASLTWA